jgi:hypothetical protein
MGAPVSVQNIVEAVIIAIGMALRLVSWKSVFANRLIGRQPQTPSTN